MVVDDGGAEASGRVDSGSGDGNGCQMNHEHGEANRQWSQNLSRRSKNKEYLKSSLNFDEIFLYSNYKFQSLSYF